MSIAHLPAGRAGEDASARGELRHLLPHLRDQLHLPDAGGLHHLHLTALYTCFDICETRCTCITFPGAWGCE